MNIQVMAGALLVTGALLIGWWSLFSDRRSQRARSSLEFSAATDRTTFRSLSLAPSAAERLLVPARERFLARLLHLTPAGWVARMQRRIDLAGAQRSWNVERLISVKAMLGGVVLVVAALAGVATGTAWLLWGSPFMGVAAFYSPDFYFTNRAQERQVVIRDEMPDIMDQIMVAVQAGLGFDAALERIATRSQGAFAEELHRVSQDVHLGLSRNDALVALAHRTDVEELRGWVNAMTQADAYGLSISQVLRVQAAELREKRRQRAEERAAKIAVKLSGPLILCIFPCIFIATLGPALLRAWDLR